MGQTQTVKTLSMLTEGPGAKPPVAPSIGGTSSTQGIPNTEAPPAYGSSSTQGKRKPEAPPLDRTSCTQGTPKPEAPHLRDLQHWPTPAFPPQCLTHFAPNITTH